MTFDDTCTWAALVPGEGPPSKWPRQRCNNPGVHMRDILGVPFAYLCDGHSAELTEALARHDAQHPATGKIIDAQGGG